MASRWKHLRRCALLDHVPCLIADAPLHISAHRKWVPVSIWFLSLIVPCAFLLTDGVFLHWQSIPAATDCPLHVSAHRKWVPASMSFKSLIIPAHSCSQNVRFCISRVSFLSLIVPCMFLLIGSEYLCQYDSCHWLSPVHSCSQFVRFCINRISFPLLIIPCAFLFTVCAYLHWQSIIPITDCPLMFLLIGCEYLYQYNTCHWLSPVHSCSQIVRFCIDRASLLPLIVPCVFLLIESEYLHHCYSYHWLSPVHSCSQYVRFYVDKVSFLPLIILCILAHRRCISALTEYHSCHWLCPACFCS